MGRKQLRILLGAAVILGAMAYFGFAGFNEGKTYYKTVEELGEMGDRAYGKRLRVAGIVGDGSIERRGTQLAFRLEQNELNLPVVYTGTTPVPDTFKDGAEAICEGQFTRAGTFEADKIQAKCASKYESEYVTTNTDTSKPAASKN